jgi:hypothetical protein
MLIYADVQVGKGYTNYITYYIYLLSFISL